MNEAESVAAVTLVEGHADAPVFVLSEPLSFWGGLDAASGTIIDRRHPEAGRSISGRIIVMEAGRGSSSGSSVLAEAIRLGAGPAGIVLLTRDAIVTVGAMVARELYGKDCPVVMVTRADWAVVLGAMHLRIEADSDRCQLLVSLPILHVDFNELLDRDLVLLSKGDLRQDANGGEVHLREGMLVSIFDEDMEDGKPDNLVARGVVERNSDTGWSSHVKWCCRIGPAGIQHESDIAEEKNRGGRSPFPGD